MARSAGPWQYLDDLSIAVCVATAGTAIYLSWIVGYPVDFTTIFSVPISLFWGFAIGVAAVSSAWALLSPILTVLVLVLIFLALRFIGNRLLGIAVVTALLFAQCAIVTTIGQSIHFLEQS